MKNILLICAVVFIFNGCSSSSHEGDAGIVAEVNKYKMSTEDLKYELKNVSYDEEAMLETEQGRKEFLDRLLEKQILLQEAQRQGLDRERDFMKSIEKYWEQTLLRLLLERKSKEISGLIHVYDNEVEESYRKSGETLPLSRVRADIIRAIRREKETEAMNTWIEELKNKTYIKVYDDVLEDVFSDN